MSYEKKLKECVKELLTKYPETRDNDTLLILSYLYEYQQGLDIAFNPFIDFDQLREWSKRLPSLMTLGRIRADLQNKYGLFLPEENVIDRREELEKEYKEEFR